MAPITVTAACASTCTPWAAPADVCHPCADPASVIDSSLLADCLQAASDILYHLSGRQFSGFCQDTVRPVLRSLNQDYGRPVRTPWPFAGPYGSWSGASGYYPPSSGLYMTNRSDRAGGQIFPEITLGVYPLNEVVEVKIDGAVLDPSLYRVDDNRWLVRLADPVTLVNPGWPSTNRMDLDDDHPGTWSATVVYGQQPPSLGVKAAAELGCQLAIACTPAIAGSCALPQRITNVTRQGESFVVLDPMSFLLEGLTGLYTADLFLRSFNAGRISRRAHVVSPDIARRVRRTG